MLQIIALAHAWQKGMTMMDDGLNYMHDLLIFNKEARKKDGNFRKDIG